MTRHRHAGAPCSVRGAPAVCAQVERVIKAVRRFPRDYSRLSARVAGFRLLTRRECAEGTRGEFKRLGPRLVPHPVFGEVFEDDQDCRGVIFFARDVDPGVIAHEFGHAVSTDADMARRRAPDDEWASELAADWYAYKWGFGRDVARARSSRRLGHHGPGPGQLIGLGERWYRASRRFVMAAAEPPAWAKEDGGVAEKK
jgi:hypothetical protein